MDFLIKGPSNVNEDTEIVTFDIVSLYTSILYEFGLGAMGVFLTTFQEDLHPRFKKKIISELGNFILKSNTLKFDSQFYLQIKGTLMSKVFAATNANLTMRYYEIKVYAITRHLL